mmetsp:Transcript_45649/g.83600  ORF Transcript_45649/g.83600 Transcript_45649/m.83600 type:complete len:365 (-) Transcript_45649:148-1242(-)
MATVDLSGSFMEVDKDSFGRAISTATTAPGSPGESPVLSPMRDPAYEEESLFSVGAVVRKRGPCVVCPSDATLTDSADKLMEFDRTAALVEDDEGAILGVITVNDLLVAFAEGVGWEASVARWLRAGDARMPEKLVPALSVRTSTTLKEAALLMKAQRGSDHASHHVVVKDAAGSIVGVLSALDLARGLCSLSEQAELQMMAEGDEEYLKAQAASSTLSEMVRGKTVSAAMKPRALLPECAGSSSLAQAFRVMFLTRQNCVAIVDHEGDADMDGGHRNVNGIITPRDLLRAFAEHVTGDTTASGWLRGLESSLEKRTVAADATLLEAADIMTSNDVHHLVVVAPGTDEVVGILSSLDLVSAVSE